MGAIYKSEENKQPKDPLMQKADKSKPKALQLVFSEALIKYIYSLCLPNLQLKEHSQSFEDESECSEFRGGCQES